MLGWPARPLPACSNGDSLSHKPTSREGCMMRVHENRKNLAPIYSLILLRNKTSHIRSSREMGKIGRVVGIPLGWFLVFRTCAAHMGLSPSSSLMVAPSPVLQLQPSPLHQLELTHPGPLCVCLWRGPSAECSSTCWASNSFHATLAPWMDL